MTQAGTHDVLNELTAIDATALVYDEQGNLTDDGTKLYLWDVTGRLKEVWNKSPESVIEQYEYDAYGRRILKNCIAGGFHYYYDGWRVVEESMSGSWTARNVWGLYLDELVVRTDVYSGGDELYPVSNPIYSPLRYYDENGDLVVRAKYTPYGKPTLLDSQGQPVTPNEFAVPILFTGQRYDAGTEAYYCKYRCYSPGLGRFLSRDPMSKATGYAAEERGDFYAYVRANPASLMDPLGLAWQRQGCNQIAWVASLSAYALAGTTGTISIWGTLCDCCDTETGDKLDYGYFQGGASAGGDIGIGVGGETKIFGLKLGLLAKGPHIPFKVEAPLGWECGEEIASRVGAEVGGAFGGHVSGGKYVGGALDYFITYKTAYGLRFDTTGVYFYLKTGGSASGHLTINAVIVEYTKEFWIEEEVPVYDREVLIHRW